MPDYSKFYGSGFWRGTQRLAEKVEATSLEELRQAISKDGGMLDVINTARSLRGEDPLTPQSEFTQQVYFSEKTGQITTNPKDHPLFFQPATNAMGLQDTGIPAFQGQKLNLAPELQTFSDEMAVIQQEQTATRRERMLARGLLKQEPWATREYLLRGPTGEEAPGDYPAARRDVLENVRLGAAIGAEGGTVAGTPEMIGPTGFGIPPAEMTFTEAPGDYLTSRRDAAEIYYGFKKLPSPIAETAFQDNVHWLTGMSGQGEPFYLVDPMKRRFFSWDNQLLHGLGQVQAELVNEKLGALDPYTQNLFGRATGVIGKTISSIREVAMILGSLTGKDKYWLEDTEGIVDSVSPTALEISVAMFKNKWDDIKDLFKDTEEAANEYVAALERGEIESGWDFMDRQESKTPEELQKELEQQRVMDRGKRRRGTELLVGANKALNIGKRNEAFLFGQEALNLYYELGQSNFSQPFFRGSWIMGEGGDKLQAMAERALIEFMIQEQRFPEEWEAEAISQHFVDPTRELGWEIMTDPLNIFELVGGYILIKGAIGGSSKAIRWAITKGDDVIPGLPVAGRAWTGAKMIGSYMGEASKVTMSELVGNNVKRITDRLASVVETNDGLKAALRAVSDGDPEALLSMNVNEKYTGMLVGKDITNAKLYDEAIAAGKTEVEARKLAKVHISGVFDEVGGADGLEKIIDEAAETVRSEHAAELIRRGVDESDAARQAVEFATSPKNTSGEIARLVRKSYLDSRRVGTTGILDEGFIAWALNTFEPTGLKKASMIGGLQGYRFLKGVWIDYLLMKRPAFAMMNFLDTTFRAKLGGARFGGTTYDVIKTQLPFVPEATKQRFKGSMFGGTDMVDLIIRGEAPDSLFGIFFKSLFGDYWKDAAKRNEALKDAGKWRKIMAFTKGGLPRFSEGMRNVSAVFEFDSAIRLTARTYEKNIELLRPIMAKNLMEALNDIGADEVVRAMINDIDNISGHNSAKVMDYAKGLATNKTTRWSHLLPDEVTDLLRNMSPSQRHNIVRSMVDKFQEVIRKTGSLQIEDIRKVSDDFIKAVDAWAEATIARLDELAQQGTQPFDHSALDEMDEFPERMREAMMDPELGIEDDLITIEDDVKITVKEARERLVEIDAEIIKVDKAKDYETFKGLLAEKNTIRNSLADYLKEQIIIEVPIEFADDPSLYTRRLLVQNGEAPGTVYTGRRAMKTRLGITDDQIDHLMDEGILQRSEYGGLEFSDEFYKQWTNEWRISQYGEDAGAMYRPDIDTEEFIAEEQRRILEGEKILDPEELGKEHAVRPAYVVLRQARLEEGKALARSSRRFGNRIDTLGRGDEVSTKAGSFMYRQGNDLDAAVHGYRKLALHTLYRPLDQKGLARANAWNQFDVFMAKVYKVTGDEKRRIMSLPNDTLAKMGDEGEFISRRALSEQVGFRFAFQDEQLQAFTLNPEVSPAVLDNWKTYKGTIADLEDMMGVYGEEQWGAPFRRLIVTVEEAEALGGGAGIIVSKQEIRTRAAEAIAAELSDDMAYRAVSKGEIKYGELREGPNKVQTFPGQERPGRSANKQWTGSPGAAGATDNDWSYGGPGSRAGGSSRNSVSEATFYGEGKEIEVGERKFRIVTPTRETLDKWVSVGYGTEGEVLGVRRKNNIMKSVERFEREMVEMVSEMSDEAQEFMSRGEIPFVFVIDEDTRVANFGSDAAAHYSHQGLMMVPERAVRKGGEGFIGYNVLLHELTHALDLTDSIPAAAREEFYVAIRQLSKNLIDNLDQSMDGDIFKFMDSVKEAIAKYTAKPNDQTATALKNIVKESYNKANTIGYDLNRVAKRVDDPRWKYVEEKLLSTGYEGLKKDQFMWDLRRGLAMGLVESLMNDAGVPIEMLYRQGQGGAQAKHWWRALYVETMASNVQIDGNLERIIFGGAAAFDKDLHRFTLAAGDALRPNAMEAGRLAFIDTMEQGYAVSEAELVAVDAMRDEIMGHQGFVHSTPDMIELERELKFHVANIEEGIYPVGMDNTAKYENGKFWVPVNDEEKSIMGGITSAEPRSAIPPEIKERLLEVRKTVIDGNGPIKANYHPHDWVWEQLDDNTRKMFVDASGGNENIARRRAWEVIAGTKDKPQPFMQEHLDVAWDSVTGTKYPDAKFTLKGHPLFKNNPDALKSFDEAVTFLKGKIDEAESAGLHHQADDRRRMLRYITQQNRQDLHRFGYSATRPTFDPPTHWLPWGAQTYITGAEDVTAHADELRGFMRQWVEHLEELVESGAPAITKLSPEQSRKLMQASKILARQKIGLIDSAMYGDEFPGLSATQRALFKGAVPSANDDLIDYVNYNRLDRWMKTAIPFWMFPSRSLPYWAATMVAHPVVPAFYNKYLNMSERFSFNYGATTTTGQQRASLRGFIPIGGGRWINPLQPISARYLTPRGDPYFEDKLESMTELQAIVHRFVRYGSMYGLNLNPIISVSLYGMNLVSPNVIPKWGIAPQQGLVPPWIWRSFQSQMLKVAGITVLDITAPEVSWKDHLVEYYMLKVLSEQMAAPRLEARDKDRNRNLAIQVQQALLQRDGNTLWDQSYIDVEKTEWHNMIIGYITGMYPKQWTTADYTLARLRDDINRLKDSINDQTMAMIFEFDEDPEKRYETYKNIRYYTDEGYLFNLRNSMRWIDVPLVGEDGAFMDVEEFQKMRREGVAEKITEDIITQEYFDSIQAAQEQMRSCKASLPINAPGALKNLCYVEYSDARALVETNPYFEVARRAWSSGYKPKEMLFENFRDEWFQMIRETKPIWDYESGQSYNQYKEAVAEWEIELPEIGLAMAPSFMGKVIGTHLLTFIEEQRENPEEIMALLLEQSHAEGYEQWDLANDDVYGALDRIWTENVVNPYWAVSEAEDFSKRKELAQQEFMASTDMSPEAIKELLVEKYGPDQFSEQQIDAALNGREGLTPDEKQLMQREIEVGEQAAALERAMWDILVAVPPGNSDELAVEIVQIGGPEFENFIDTWYLTQSGESFKDPDFFAKGVAIVKQAAANLGWDKPTRSELEEWGDAQELNQIFRDKIVVKLGVDFYDFQAKYYALKPDDRTEFREENPAEYEKIKEYRVLREAFAEEYPLWQKYYFPDFEKKAAGGGGGRAGGRGVSRAARPSIQDFGTFAPFGKRSTLDATELLGDRVLGRGGATGKPWWPAWYLDKVGEAMARELEDLAKGTPLSEEAKEYALSRMQNYPDEVPLLKPTLKDALPSKELFDRDQRGVRVETRGKVGR